MGSLPNSLPLVYNLPPNGDHDQALTLPPNNFETTNPSSEAGRTTGTQKPEPGRYLECLRNHGAAIGAHVLDGCGEFMPGGEDGTPESFKCDACECHRNFHRKVAEVDGGGFAGFTSSVYRTNLRSYSGCIPGKDINMIPQRPLLMPSMIRHHRHQKRFPAAPVMVAFGGGAGPLASGSSSEDDLNTDDNTTTRSDSAGRTFTDVHHQQSNSKNKRSRTKFTPEQKEKMASFAEKLDWKMGKHDEHELMRFCAEVRVNRQVFKVWMHNSKQAMKKKLQM